MPGFVTAAMSSLGDLAGRLRDQGHAAIGGQAAASLHLETKTIYSKKSHETAEVRLPEGEILTRGGHNTRSNHASVTE